MGKFVKLLLLFCLLATIITGALMQTPFAQNKLRGWIEDKYESAVTIGKLEGFFPFWLRLRDVHYQQETMDARFDQMDIFLSPGTIFFGHLSLFRLHINDANIQTESNSSKQWPSTSFPIFVHSMRIDSLTFNQIEGLSFSGMGEISEDFSFHLSLSYEDYLLRLGLEGNAEERTIDIVTQIKQSPDINFWLSGTYDWENALFTGKTIGNARSWKVKSDLTYSDSELSFTNASVEKNHYVATGDATLDLVSHRFHSEGTFLERPFSTSGKLEWKKSNIDLSNFLLRYSDNTFQGRLNFIVKTASLAGEIDVELNDLSPYPTKHPLEGQAHAHLSIHPERTTFTLSGKDIRWKDLTFSEMALKGEWKEELLTFQLSLHEFIVLDPAYEVFPTAHLKLDGKATREQIDLQGEVWGVGSTPFILAAEIPIEFTPKPFDITIDRDAPFAISLKGKGSIDPILSFLENASLIARGEIDVDLKLTGAWDDPVIEGTLIYDNGWVESLATGAVYRDIHMELEGEGNELKIRSLIAHDHDRGDLSGTGQIKWDPNNGFPFAFELNSHHFTLLAIDPLTANANAKLSISGTINEISITGEATIVEGHLALPNKMPPQVAAVDVTYINPLPTPKPEIEETQKTIPIHLNIQIDIPNKLTIEGRGLISDWRGSLHMSGLQDDLQYSGKLKLVQGRFTIVGRTFDLIEGKIQIQGLEPKDIVVDLKGDLELATVTASILVSGSLDSTHLSFSSNPPMGTNQILSWILFNQDVNELTAFQACRLANALVSLSGKYAGPKMFDNIKKGLGIDVFDITNCDVDSADLTFQVGKYISQGTFVGVSKSLSGDFDSVLIQTRLYRNFYLEGDYGGSLNGLTPNGGKLIFKWYKTY